MTQGYPHPRISSNSLSGFSLVEISIVLVLISLIIGGIMAGLNIKHTAELKSVTDENTRIRDAIGLFQDRYKTLPGDMYNATKYWGAADADANNCKSTVSTDRLTCNGDGNGMVTTPGDGSTYYEAHRFWQHLVNANLLDGKYTGQRAGTNNNATCLSNNHCGKSSYKNGIYYPASIKYTLDYFKPAGLPGLLMYPGDKGNVLVLFRNSNQGVNGAYVGTPLFTTEDTFNIDTKVDDGKPASGLLQTFKPEAAAGYLNTACATTDDENTAAYNLATNSGQCALIFTNIF